MAASTEPSLIRISLIAGRHLVFDPAAASLLRRDQNTCGNLVGTLPQQPVQNVFLALPIEVRPEEAQALVQRGAAYVVDNVAAHKAALTKGRPNHKKYIDGLRQRKEEMKKETVEHEAKRRAKSVQMAAKAKKTRHATAKETLHSPATPSEAQEGEVSVFDQPATVAERPPSDLTQSHPWAVTPTSSNGLLPEHEHSRASLALESPLSRFLQNSGYYITPGLRFGCRFSVYPGDPLRFHAHYMANDYEWDEPIPILDIVEGGRLATAVKKSFLIGGNDVDEVSPSGYDNVRTFSLEWAGM